MGLSLFLGCLLISNGPNFALLWPVSQRSHLLIIMVFSSFFWWLSIAVLSTIAAIITPLRDTRYIGIAIPLSVLLQTAGRWLYFQLFK